MFSYRAGQGERNSPYVQVDRSSGQIVVESAEGGLSPTPPSVRPVAGPGCTRGPNDRVVRCALSSGAALPRLSVALGDASDHGHFAAELVGAVNGGTGEDSLSGAGVLDGGAGDDEVHGGTARGGIGDDELSGIVLEGGPGDDRLLEGPVKRGGPGDDLFQGDDDAGQVYHLGPGRDTVYGGDRADTIFARDGEPDDLTCLGGRDTVVLDALDFADQGGGDDGRCERVRRRGLARPVTLGALAYLEEYEEDYGGTYGPNELAVTLACPYDGPRLCAGTLTVSDRRGTVVQRRFRTGYTGRWPVGFRMKRRELRRLDNWARITVVSFDRLGRRHRHTIAGHNVVNIFVYVPLYEPDSASLGPFTYPPWTAEH